MPTIFDDDEMAYAEAVRVVREDNRGSTSLVQRKLQIGYNRAARIMERMEADGIISKPDCEGQRTVL